MRNKGTDGAVLRRGVVDGVTGAGAGRMGMHQGDVRVLASKKRSTGLGTVTWGAVDGCVGNGGAHRRGVVLRRREGRGWRGVEMNLDNFNPHLAFIPVAHHCRF